MQHVYGPLALVTLAFSLQGRYEFRQVAYSESAMDWTCLSGVRCLAFSNSGVGTGLLPAYRCTLLVEFPRVGKFCWAFSSVLLSWLWIGRFSVRCAALLSYWCWRCLLGSSPGTRCWFASSLAFRLQRCTFWCRIFLSCLVCTVVPCFFSSCCWYGARPLTVGNN